MAPVLGNQKNILHKDVILYRYFSILAELLIHYSANEMISSVSLSSQVVQINVLSMVFSNVNKV